MRTNTANLHPEIAKVLPKWERVRVLLEELEDQYADPKYFLRLPNEEADDYSARREAFILGFVNEAGRLLRAKGAAVFKQDIQRNNLTPMQEVFVKRADESGQSLEEIMQNEAAPGLAGYGTLFAVLDKPPVIAVNAQEEESKGVPYLTILSPFQVEDFEWDDDGELKWFRYRVDRPEPREPDAKRPRAKASDYNKTITWTREKCITKGAEGKPDEVDNPFGFVPVVIQAQFLDPNKTIGKSSFFSTSRYIFAGNNLLHAGNYEVFRIVSAILMMNIQDVGDEDYEKPVDEKTGLRKLEQKSKEQKRILVFTNPEGKPEYLKRDPAVVKTAQESAAEYFERAADNEASAMSVNTAKAPESGISKAYDFTDVNWVLTEFSRCLGRAESQILRMVARMVKQPLDKFSVTYPTDFDVRDFNARIAFVKGLMGVSFPSAIGMREAYKAITPEITQKADLVQEINEELDEWEPAELEADPSNPGDTKPGEAPGDKMKPKPKPKPGAAGERKEE